MGTRTATVGLAMRSPVTATSSLISLIRLRTTMFLADTNFHREEESMAAVTYLYHRVARASEHTAVTTTAPATRAEAREDTILRTHVREV
mmetsp:Transcript_6109/g.16647  ORF Transcript_6109/g.16647 Transcript_6109/m.16647 type:complete len:90 (-) Transcript_6109:1084-1353(-)